MIIRLLPGLVLGMLALPVTAPAMAASFDCAKAQTSVERAVCADTELSGRDGVLAKAYATATGGLSAPALETMRQSQRQWLTYLGRVCTRTAQPQAEDYDLEGIECLRGAYDERIAGLEHSRMLGGLRFYPIDAFAVLKDPQAEPDDLWQVATKAFRTLNIDGTDREAEAFNAFIAERTSTSRTALGFGEEPTESEAPGSTDESYLLSLDAVTPARITLALDTFWYGHGAAHGNFTLSHLHFLRTEGRGLAAEDIFSGAGWQDALKTSVVAEIERTLADGLIVENFDDIDPTITNPDSWSFSETGLTVQFQPYEITAYAAGAPTVTIPWSELADYLSDAAPAITGGYW